MVNPPPSDVPGLVLPTELSCPSPPPNATRKRKILPDPQEFSCHPGCRGLGDALRRRETNMTARWSPECDCQSNQIVSILPVFREKPGRTREGIKTDLGCLGSSDSEPPERGSRGTGHSRLLAVRRLLKLSELAGRQQVLQNGGHYLRIRRFVLANHPNVAFSFYEPGIEVW